MREVRPTVTATRSAPTGGPVTRAILLTALAPVSWGTTYAVTTELLPPDRPSSPA